jgi:hypothetical protein
MNDVPPEVIRQEAWQRERQKLSWAEKIRIAEAVRESAIAFRKTRPPVPAPTAASKPEPAK